MLIERESGEQHVHADVVIDCTGGFSQPNPLGDGGVPALGESSVRSAIHYGIANTGNLSAYQGKRVLVAGGATVLALKQTTLRHHDGSTSIVEVGTLIAATGYRPDRSITRELHIQTCWATEGTCPLTALLLRETGGDCLAVSGFGADTLKHPESGYYAIDMKSCGAHPTFSFAQVGIRWKHCWRSFVRHCCLPCI